MERNTGVGHPFHAAPTNIFALFRCVGVNIPDIKPFFSRIYNIHHNKISMFSLFAFFLNE